MQVTNSSTNGDKVTLDLGSSGHAGTIHQGYSPVASTILWDTPPPTVGGAVSQRMAEATEEVPITMVPVYTYARANRDRPMECDRHHQPPDRGWADHRKVRARARQHGAGCLGW